jgi:hypothetical protein
MDPRNPKNNSASNAAELWKRTDKKTAQFTLWNKEKQENKIGKSADNALQNAGGAAYTALPLITAAGVSLCTQGEIGFVFGFPMAVGGIFLDAIKAPICLAIAGEEAVRGGTMKLASLVFEKQPTQAAIDRIFKSFLIRLRETATILVALGLEQTDALDTKLQSGDIEELVGLTLLHTAYASRHYHGGLLLATNKRLERNDCPAEGLTLFDEVMELKKLINQALVSANSPASRTDQQRDLEESRIVCQWMALVKAGVPLTTADKPDATAGQIAIVNKIMAQIDNLKLIGMSAMPESPRTAVSHMPKF